MTDDGNESSSSHCLTTVIYHLPSVT